MNILKFNKISLAALLLASMALVMLPGCSSTEEAPPPAEGTAPPPPDDTSGDCNCAEGDFQCKEACMQDLPI
jgi:hypothetical protein